MMIIQHRRVEEIRKMKAFMKLTCLNKSLVLIHLLQIMFKLVLWYPSLVNS